MPRNVIGYRARWTPGSQDAVQGEMHGYAIARWIFDRSGEVLQIEEGTLYPAWRTGDGSGRSRG